jgi:hypothetical protein
MSLTELPVETTGNDIASARARLDREIGLVAQLEREGERCIRLVEPAAP